MTHSSTSNKSFVEISNFLKDEGISNNTFMLQLMDPSIENVDPFDPNLSNDLKRRIIIECCRNPWYYLREIVRVPAQGGGYTPFILHRGNLAMAFLFFTGFDSYVSLPRLTHSSMSAICIISHPFMMEQSTDVAFIHKSIDDGKTNLNKLKSIVDGLPDYVKPVIEEDNTTSCVNSITRSRLSLVPRAKSEQTAHAIGRGLTQPVQHFDDFEYIEFMDIILNVSMSPYTKSKLNARHENKICGRIITSTPCDPSSPLNRKAFAILDDTCEFNENMYDIYAQKGYSGLHDFISSRSSNGIVYIEFSYDKLGKDEKWFIEMCKSVNYNIDVISRELLLQRGPLENKCEKCYHAFKDVAASFISELKKEMGTDVELRLDSKENFFEIIKIDTVNNRRDGVHYEELPSDNLGTISDEELDKYRIMDSREREIVRKAYSSHPKGFYPNPYCALR